MPETTPEASSAFYGQVDSVIGRKCFAYGKAPGLEYSVRTEEGAAVCTCAYNPDNHTDKLELARRIALALTVLRNVPTKTLEHMVEYNIAPN